MFTFTFVAMGQGDCCLVRCPDGQVVVVDCGTTGNVQGDPLYFRQAQHQLRSLQWAGGRGNVVAALILTHYDIDHGNRVWNLFSGPWRTAADVTLPSGVSIAAGTELAKVGVARVLISSASLRDAGYKTPMGYYDPGAFICENYLGTQTIEEVSIKSMTDNQNFVRTWTRAKNFADDPPGITPVANKRYRVLWGGDGEDAWSVEVIAGNVPVAYGGPAVSTPVNAASLITLFTIGTRKALLCGDATLSTERFLVQAHAGLIGDVDLLQVPHHGSPNASSAPFIALTNPAYGVVSVGFMERGYLLPRYTNVLESWIERVEARGKEVGAHDVDYWYGSDLKTLDEKWEEWRGGGMNDDEVVVDGRFKYKIKPEAGDYAMWVGNTDGALLFRENVDLAFVETAMKTQVFTLAKTGVTYGP